MAAEGGEVEQVLEIGGSPKAFLERALKRVGDAGSVDHVIGIATAIPLETWMSRMGSVGRNGLSGRILDVEGQLGTNPWADGPAGFDIRAPSDGSLGDLGIGVIDSLTEVDPQRPAVIVDSVAALTDDPGTRFKFLTLLSHRIRKDDGLFLVFAGEDKLPDHEIQTLEGVFDEIRRTDG